MTLEQVLQAVRDWLQDANTTGTALADTKVLVANPGPGGAARQAMPYLVVNITGERNVGDEARSSYTGSVATPTWKVKGQRRASCSVNAYGDGGVELLRQAVIRLRHPSVQAVLTTLGISVRPIGDPRNLTALRDSSFEARWLQEFEIGYNWTSTAEAALPALIGEVTTTLTAPDGTVRAPTTFTYPAS